MSNDDYLIPEFESRLKEAAGLKEKINNSEPERLLSVHHQLEKEFQQLMDKKTRLYLKAKEAIEKGKFQLVFLPDRNLLGYVHGFTQAGHPDIRYADGSDFTAPIATFKGQRFIKLTLREFMSRLMSGDYVSFSADPVVSRIRAKRVAG